jgi:hypothetical protein
MHHSFLQRLAFVKFLYTTGIKQAQAPEPLASAGLLMLHDAIELFFDLAWEHLNCTEQRREFKDYWGPINAKLKEKGQPTLHQQTPVIRLNKARVALKHHGGHPSKMDLEAYRNTAREFFTDNCPLIFDVSLESLSMAEFVQPEDARKQVEEAIQLRAEGKFDEAAHKLVVAFETMRYHHMEPDDDRPGASPFSFGPNLSFVVHQFKGLRDYGNGDAERGVADIVHSVTELKRAMQVLALGLDFRRYIRFTSHMPICMRMANGNFRLQEMRTYNRNAETIQFCTDFVIEAALQMGGFEYNV